MLGSLGFIVWNEIYEKIKTKSEKKYSNKKIWSTFSVHSKIVISMLVFMIAFGTLGILILEFDNPNTLGEYNVPQKIVTALFHGISARTTGMAVLDLKGLTNSGKFFTIILMLVGGAPGSTAGGIKTVTFAVLLITMLSSVSNNKNVNIFKRQIPEETIRKAITVLISALIIISSMSVILSALNPEIAFIDILFEVASALATCGYSLGITTSLTVTSKVLLIVIMYIGRVSTVTMAMAVAGKSFKQSNVISYPKADVNVG